jgi:hypothetical protein
VVIIVVVSVYFCYVSHIYCFYFHPTLICCIHDIERCILCPIFSIIATCDNKNTILGSVAVMLVDSTVDFLPVSYPRWRHILGNWNNCYHRAIILMHVQSGENQSSNLIVPIVPH